MSEEGAKKYRKNWARLIQKIPRKYLDMILKN
jgi:hypothetical protein